MFPKISAREIALEAKVQIPVSRWCEREMSREIPFIIRFNSWLVNQFLYICKSVPVISTMWYLKVSLGSVCILALRMCSFRDTHLRFRPIIQVIFRTNESDHCVVPNGIGMFHTNRSEAPIQKFLSRLFNFFFFIQPQRGSMNLEFRNQ